MKATESKLSELHGVLATVLIAQLKEIGVEEDIEQGMEEGKEHYTASPALLTVCARFLKDNEITCEVGDSSKMNELKEQLKDRKKGKRLSLVPPLGSDVEEEMAAYGR